MDNVTHSLIGVLLGRAALPWVGSLRGALWAAVLASNAPDLDLALTPFFEDRRLGYLVHHRGHTHTLVVSLGLAIGAALFAKWRDKEAKLGPLLGLAVVGNALHIGADAWNNYGVHPFWPLENSWYYGDFIFILEPLLWLALLPLAARLASRPWRYALGGLFAGMVAATTFGLGAAAGAVFALATGGLAVAAVRAGPSVGLAGAAGLPATLAVAALGAFKLSEGAADANLRAAFAAARPDAEVLDVVLAPRPATPWCWEGLVLSLDGDRYAARSVRHSLAPALTGPAACAVERRGSGRTAPMLAADLPASEDTVWGERFDGPADGVARLAAASCRADAFLRFGRAPYWTDDGDGVILGDLRYDREDGLGFAEIELRRDDGADAAGCANLPPWRSDVARRLLQVEVR